MPNGGLSMYGSGIQAQPASPGITQQGNVNIAGTLIAQTGITTTDPTKLGTSASGENFGHANSWTNGASFPATATLMYGMANETYWGPSNGVIFGRDNFAGGQHFVCIGASNICGSYAQIPAGCIALGWGNNVNPAGGTESIQNTVAVGIGNYVNNGSMCFGSTNNVRSDNTINHDQMVFGYNNSAINSSGQNVILGRGIVTTHTNALIIGWFNANQPVDVDNAIVIGNVNQPLIRLGPYLIQNGLATTQFTMIGNATIANTAAETTLIGTINGSTVIPSNRLTAGATVRLRLRGVIADTLTPTIRFRAYLNGTAYIDTGVVALVALGGTQSWTMEGEISVRTTGAGGTALGNGHVEFSLATQSDMDSLNVAASAIDTTVAQTVNWTVQWGTANPANTITNTIGTCEIVG